MDKKQFTNAEAIDLETGTVNFRAIAKTAAGVSDFYRDRLLEPFLESMADWYKWELEDGVKIFTAMVQHDVWKSSFPTTLPEIIELRAVIPTIIVHKFCIDHKWLVVNIAHHWFFLASNMDSNNFARIPVPETFKLLPSGSLQNALFYFPAFHYPWPEVLIEKQLDRYEGFGRMQELLRVDNGQPMVALLKEPQPSIKCCAQQVNTGLLEATQMFQRLGPFTD